MSVPESVLSSLPNSLSHELRSSYVNFFFIFCLLFNITINLLIFMTILIVIVMVMLRRQARDVLAFNTVCSSCTDSIICSGEKPGASSLCFQMGWNTCSIRW